MHPTTIKKYWKLLEDCGLIKYEGPRRYFDDWNEEFKLRKKDGGTYYSIPKKDPYRIMPKETLDKIQNDYLVTERELKLYLLLAEMQERFCYLKSPERVFTIADLRGLLKLKKDSDNNRSIINGLIWLKALGLIDYSIAAEENNLHQPISIFTLIAVNYYTTGGEAAKYLNSEEERISPEFKEDLLNNSVITIFE